METDAAIRAAFTSPPDHHKDLSPPATRYGFKSRRVAFLRLSAPTLPALAQSPEKPLAGCPSRRPDGVLRQPRLPEEPGGLGEDARAACRGWHPAPVVRPRGRVRGR